MTSLVLELQREALDHNIRVSDLLRKAFVISRKLKIIEIQEWINYELNGYSNEAAIVPSYREVCGIPKVWNPYNGWQLLNVHDSKLAKLLSKRQSRQAIGELDELVAKGDSGLVGMNYPHDIAKWLMENMEFPLQPVLAVSYTCVVGILDAVRNKVLDWTLQLEEQGVIGEGMSFTEKERQSAQTVTYQVTNNIGSMQNSQFQQDSSNATQSLTIGLNTDQLSGFIEELKKEIDKLKLDAAEKDELRSEIATIESQIISPKPKHPIVKESLRTVRTLLESVSGSVIANGLLAHLAKIYF